MKVITDRAALENAVRLVAGVVVSRTTTPVLRCIRLSADAGRLVLSATDQEVWLRLGLEEVEVAEPGEVLVPADKLHQVVQSCDDPTLTLETDGMALRIVAPDSNFRINGFDPADAPEVSGFEDASVDCEIEAGTLQRLVALTRFAAATETIRYAVSGVLFHRDGKSIRFVATDGKRLAMARGHCASGQGTAECIIPLKALQLVQRLTSNPEAIIRIAVDEQRIRFNVTDGGGEATLTSSLVEGRFPPYDDVIPKDQDKRVSFDVELLSKAVRRAALLTNDESKGVRMTFDDQHLTLKGQAPEMGEAVVRLALEGYEGDALEIGFNPTYLTDALKVVESDHVIIELKAPNRPGVLKTGDDFTYVIMPVSLQ